MEKRYDPRQIEQRWYNFWEQQGCFEPSGEGEPYTIMLPPPNVTGSLHMGHGFQHTLMDVLVRYQRMQGRRVLWQCGTDHAGIATQMVVERQLEAAGQSRAELGREAFVERVWEWKAQSGGRITTQMRQLGASPDWQRERFTMDPALSKAVTECFVRLHQKGLIYRGKRLVNWDPQLKTAISDLEVVAEEEAGKLWYFRYPLSSGDGFVTVATTRPETMLGDTAVAVNPNDKRYRKLIGESVELPLCGRALPIIADEEVDPEFGTGCVKITPAHDFADYEMGQRHSLPMINIFTAAASLNDEVPAAFSGLDRFEARRRVVAALESEGLLEKVEDHKLKIPRGDRSGQILEPWLTDQWFVRTAEMARDATEVVHQGDVKFVPKHWENTYFAWLGEIQDWCISRQLWWGHRIPVWYDEAGNSYAGHSEADVRQRHQLDAALPLRQDEDVLDTWFSSALWTFSTLGWPEKTTDLEIFHPTSVLVTGFDIIFFWVARMVMMTREMLGEVPFSEVYVTGLVRDSQGQKMSKSRGNVLDPIDLINGIDLESLVSKRLEGLMQPKQAKRIEKQTRREFPSGIEAHGADALRFTFTALASTSRDLNFDMGRIRGYRNFCTKLWNAARFVLERLSACDWQYVADHRPRSIYSRWLYSRLQRCQQSCEEALREYRFDLYAGQLYQFIWHEYCDWYLEMAKVTLDGDNPELTNETCNTLLQVLEQLLRMAHPVIPFITEEIWQRLRPLLPDAADSIMNTGFPLADDSRDDPQAEEETEWFCQLIQAVRNIRGEYSVPVSRELEVILSSANPADAELLKQHSATLKVMAGLSELRWQGQDQPLPVAAMQALGNMEILIPLAGVIDAESEAKRLNKGITNAENEYQRNQKMLDSADFVAKAPSFRVEQVREKVKQQQQIIDKLTRQLALIRSLD